MNPEASLATQEANEDPSNPREKKSKRGRKPGKKDEQRPGQEPPKKDEDEAMEEDDTDLNKMEESELQ